jgi:hypothetical protein
LVLRLAHHCHQCSHCVRGHPSRQNHLDKMYLRTVWTRQIRLTCNLGNRNLYYNQISRIASKIGIMETACLRLRGILCLVWEIPDRRRRQEHQSVHAAVITTSKAGLCGNDVRWQKYPLQRARSRERRECPPMFQSTPARKQVNFGKTYSGRSIHYCQQDVGDLVNVNLWRSQNNRKSM